MDQPRHDALYERFQRQVSIPNCPDKLSDEELTELILALREDAASSGKRAARKDAAKKEKASSAPAAPISASNLDALLAKMEAITKPKGENDVKST